jgi:hypothetical protein
MDRPAIPQEATEVALGIVGPPTKRVLMAQRTILLHQRPGPVLPADRPHPAGPPSDDPLAAGRAADSLAFGVQLEAGGSPSTVSRNNETRRSQSGFQTSSVSRIRATSPKAFAAEGERPRLKPAAAARPSGSWASNPRARGRTGDDPGTVPAPPAGPAPGGRRRVPATRPRRAERLLPECQLEGARFRAGPAALCGRRGRGTTGSADLALCRPREVAARGSPARAGEADPRPAARRSRTRRGPPRSSPRPVCRLRGYVTRCRATRSPSRSRPPASGLHARPHAPVRPRRTS